MTRFYSRPTLSELRQMSPAHRDAAMQQIVQGEQWYGDAADHLTVMRALWPVNEWAFQVYLRHVTEQTVLLRMQVYAQQQGQKGTR